MNIIKRDILKGIAVGSAWSAPIVSSVTLPAHAESTVDTGCSYCGSELSTCNQGSQVVIADTGGNVNDDGFNVYIDGQCVGHLPAGLNGASRCVSGISGGIHSLRIEFVVDTDDPDGLSSDEDGLFLLNLQNGVAIAGGPVFSGCTDCEETERPSNFSATVSLFPQCGSVEYQIRVPDQ